jgi:hypothetical protein
MTTTTVILGNGTTDTFEHRAEINISTNNGAAWITCSCCGRGDYAARFSGKSHKSFCDLRGVRGFTPVSPAARDSAPPSSMQVGDLARASDIAKRTGLVSGAFRTEDDVLAAVHAGYLSADAAMNRDD